MVLGLNDIIGRNARAVAKTESAKPKVPESIALNPSLARRYVNSPWTREELGGRPTAQETYARDAAAPFAGKGLTDRLDADKKSETRP